MTPRPDQTADQIEGWIASQSPDSAPADIVAALDMVSRRATMRSAPGSAATLTITPADIVSADDESLGPVTRQQMYDAVHAWEQTGQTGSSPTPSLWHHTPDYAIHVRYEHPAGSLGPHYVHLTAYHQDTRPGQEHLADARLKPSSTGAAPRRGHLPAEHPRLFRWRTTAKSPRSPFAAHPELVVRRSS